MSTTRTWQASWIEPVQEDVTEEPEFTLAQMFEGDGTLPEQAPVEERLHPSPLLKRVFTAKEPVAKATLYITARGLYKATLNGVNVTEAQFTPDFTDYAKILMYQTYDVTDLVREGTNVWGIVLADGWYAGRIAVQGDSAQFGKRLSVLGELELEYDDGTTETVCTDDKFYCSTGKYVYADIQIGECQDLRLLDDDWDSDPSVEGWQSVLPASEPLVSDLVEQVGPQVVRCERLAAEKVWREDDALIVDFGQVICGRVQLACTLAEGQRIELEHSEALTAEGKFFMNIKGRNKDAKDVYIGRGTYEVLEPDFTFHGFRYVRITGWEGDFDRECITAIALRSDLENVGTITTSDRRVNRLLENIQWSQRGNMLSIPTDCPQRERMGWTGDLRVYQPTGCFFMNLKDFLERWLDQVMADQLDNGEIVDYSPSPKSALKSVEFTGSMSSAGWGDAIIFVPWELYRQYGDIEPLERCYDSMIRWDDFCVTSAAGDKDGDDRYIWDTKFHYGDWMLPSMLVGGANPMEGALYTKDLIATCFLAEQATLLAQIADLLGYPEKAAEKREYAENVRRAFTERFYLGDGKLSVEVQGSYVCALHFDMLPEAERQATADHLSTMVRANGNRLDTGFCSVPYLLDELDAWGHEDIADDVFWQSDWPSWLYEVDHGATTIWENWANVSPDGTVGDYSFNHYAFGCVADWIVRRVGGLQIREPAYTEFNVAPKFLRDLDHCHLKHDVAGGTIRIAWTRGQDNTYRVEVAVPQGCRAHVMLPGCSEKVCEPGSYVFYC